MIMACMRLISWEVRRSKSRCLIHWVRRVFCLHFSRKVMIILCVHFWLRVLSTKLISLTIKNYSASIIFWMSLQVSLYGWAGLMWSSQSILISTNLHSTVPWSLIDRTPPWFTEYQMWFHFQVKLFSSIWTLKTTEYWQLIPMGSIFTRLTYRNYWFSL